MLSCVRLFATPRITAHQASLSITNSWSSLNSCPSSQWCHPAISSSVVPFSSCLQSLPASIFSSESTLRMRWPKYWSFSFSISPSNEHPGLISFRMDWLDLLAVQGTLKSLLQHYSSPKYSILSRTLGHSYSPAQVMDFLFKFSCLSLCCKHGSSSGQIHKNGTYLSQDYSSFNFHLKSTFLIFLFFSFTLWSPQNGWFSFFLFFCISPELIQGFPYSSVVKNPLASTEYTGSIPGSRRSPGGGNGNPLQYSCLENPMERGVWWAIVHEVTESKATEQLNMQAEVTHIILEQLEY